MKPQDDRAKVSHTGLMAALETSIAMLPKEDSPLWELDLKLCIFEVTMARDYLERLKRNLDA